MDLKSKNQTNLKVDKGSAMNKKTRKPKLKVIMKIVVSVVILLLIGGMWQYNMMNKESQMFLPQGKRFTINSHDMHVYSVGTAGSLTIVFVAGSGTPNAFTDFYYLQNELQQYARTVSFDHAGFGWSEQTHIPRTIDTLVDELHELLNTSNETAPYVLIGHSLASLEVLRFAQRYPDEVEQIILLDGGSPEYYANARELQPYLINRFMAGLRVTGIARALGNIGVLLPFTAENIRNQRLPIEWKATDLAMYYNHIGESNNLSFIKNMNENARAVLDGGYLKDTPLLILSSDSGGEWAKVQRQLLQWSSLSKQETISDSEHYIHWSNREEVLQKIVNTINNN